MQESDILRPPQSPWLIEAELLRGDRPEWLRAAVLAPTAKAAAERLQAALSAGAGGKVVVQRTKTGENCTLDEEAALLAALDDANPVATSAPVWATVRGPAGDGVLRPGTAPAAPEGAQGLDLLPQILRGGRIHAVLDGAEIFGLVEQLDGSGLDWRCLFQGSAAEDHAVAAPYLVELAAGNPLTARLLRPGRTGGNALQHGLFIASPVSLGGLWRHLRQFTMMMDPEAGRRVFFRFYDPMIFRTLMVNLAPENLAQFCTGIDALAVTAADGSFVTVERTRA
ncbi:MAG: DUF4123 domain-containing protein [Paracoccus sp. (in: a-proteobacteria)]|nr:DUF4123 domain-containing protein [Paracoccus sp. (in: a-proteobacteria)]